MDCPTKKNEKGYASDVIKLDQLVFFAPKEWGHEEWIVNKPEYCGKKLVFKPGYQCSMHHHKVKDETFHVLSGIMVLETEVDGVYKARVMTAGDTAHIAPLVWHRLSAATPANVMEFSTFHREEDSYRRTMSGKADFQAMGVALQLDTCMSLYGK